MVRRIESSHIYHRSQTGAHFRIQLEAHSVKSRYCRLESGVVKVDVTQRAEQTKRAPQFLLIEQLSIKPDLKNIAPLFLAAAYKQRALRFQIRGAEG